MTRTVRGLYRAGRDLVRDRRGIVAPAYALMMASLLAVGGMAIDVGNVMRVKQALQSSVDAAALAGAGPLYLAATTAEVAAAKAVATSYSAGSGNANAIPNVTATMLSGYPQVACLRTLQAAPYSLPCPTGGGTPFGWR